MIDLDHSPNLVNYVYGVNCGGQFDGEMAARVSVQCT